MTNASGSTPAPSQSDAASGSGAGQGLEAYLARQMEWSKRVFGERSSAIGLTKHIEKECVEVRANPTDLVEWVDIISLALDGYWRHGGTPETILRDLNTKQQICFAREWTVSENPGEPNEHIRPATALEEAMFCGPAAPSPSPQGDEMRELIRPLDGDTLVEALAQHLHDEEFPDHKGNGWTWPEHAEDEGYRGREGNPAWVTITPTDVQFECREAAARILGFVKRRLAPPASAPAQSAEGGRS